MAVTLWSCGELRQPAFNDVKKPVYLSLGSNLGDRQANLHTAIVKLVSLGEVIKVSCLYETEPVELREQPWFLNCAVLMQTELLPGIFLRRILGIEREMGRKRTRPKGPRTIDIDILLFGNATIETPELRVPHPAMHKRRFVLAPLAEIAAEVRHPVMKRTARELLEALPPERAKVKRLSTSKKFSQAYGKLDQ